MRCVLTALQRAQVSDDRPAIRHDDVWSVGHHCVFAIRDRVENFAIGHLADPFVLKRNDSREAVLLCDPVACCSSAVTHRASDVETLLPALHQLGRNRNRNACSPVIAHLASVVIIGAGTEISVRMRPVRTHVATPARRVGSPALASHSQSAPYPRPADVGRARRQKDRAVLAHEPSSGAPYRGKPRSAARCSSGHEIQRRATIAIPHKTKITRKPRNIFSPRAQW